MKTILYLIVTTTLLLLSVFSLQAQNTICLDLYTTGISEKGCIELEWQWLPPAPTGNYGFTFYQWDEILANWQTGSTNYDKTIQVLNVYPDIAGSNNLQTWMNDPEIGLGKIIVTPVTITNFNANPDLYLKVGNEYKYDVIMFGSWDSNNNLDLNTISVTAVKNFLSSGRGVLFGHDTQHRYNSFFSSLADYTNLYIANSGTMRGSDRIKVVNDGFLLKYPHHIPFGDTLVIPSTHSTLQYARGIVWMNFPTTQPSYPGSIQIINGGTNDFYLTTWNNAAMIQTGHSNGASTLDERKIIANTLWYLAQFTTETSAILCSALDLAPPDNPAAERRDCYQIDLLSKDNGSPYSFYIKATNTTDYSDTCRSNILEVINTSNLRGFYILEDISPTSGTDLSISPFATFIAAGDNHLVTYTIQDLTKYVHIQAVDFARNLSEVITIEPEECNSASFYVNNVYYEDLQDTVFCAKNVYFSAEIVGFHEGKDSLKWYINGEEEVSARNQLEWNKELPNGEYVIKMEVIFENGVTITKIGTFKRKDLWIKMRNIKKN